MSSPVRLYHACTRAPRRFSYPRARRMPPRRGRRHSPRPARSTLRETGAIFAGHGDDSVAAVTTTIERGVARVVLDRPPVNVIDLATAGELAAALEPLAADTRLCALVIEARGRVFSAG